MYFAILRNTNDTTLPPAVVRSETAKGIRYAMEDLSPQGWECVFLAEGEEIDRPVFFDEGKEFRYDN